MDTLKLWCRYIDQLDTIFNMYFIQTTYRLNVFLQARPFSNSAFIEFLFNFIEFQMLFTCYLLHVGIIINIFYI